MTPILAAAASEVNTGDTAWMLIATALVLFMTIGLGLFYSGLVRAKNSLNTYMMSVAAIAVAAVTWVVVGYSFAFDGDGDLEADLLGEPDLHGRATVRLDPLELAAVTLHAADRYPAHVRAVEGRQDVVGLLGPNDADHEFHCPASLLSTVAAAGGAANYHAAWTSATGDPARATGLTGGGRRSPRQDAGSASSGCRRP